MKKKNLIKRASILTVSLVILTSSVAFGHSGRTDSSGGHKDNKNKSGLGSYHYHHGMGPHLHSNGECPYSSKPEAVPASSKSVTVAKPKTTNATNNATSNIYAQVPNFPVKISGTDINTSNSEYAPIVFNDITYIPLTSDIIGHLNLNYKWDDPSNLIFNRSSKNVDTKKQFTPIFTNGSSGYGHTIQINKVNKGITVNGLWVTNKYPVISSKGINYLPLTSDIITNLGLTGGWDQVNGFDLIIK